MENQTLSVYKIVPNPFGNDVVFWVKRDGSQGCRIINGVETIMNPTPTTCENSKNKTNAGRKQRYLQFKHAFGEGKHILVSHAVYTAFVGPIPDDADCIDHLNGCTTDNRPENLEPVTFAENNRRAKYIRIMRECNFDPRIFIAADFHYWFSMPFEEFKSFFEHYKND